MLNKYNKHLNLDVLNEEVILPDPPGLGKLYDTKSYHPAFQKLMLDAVAKAKKTAAEEMAEQLKKDWVGKIVAVSDENGRQRIVEVNDTTVANVGSEFYPYFVEDKDRKIRYYWENDGRSRIFDLSKFLDFFEEHYLDKLLSFQGRPVRGGDVMKYTKHVVKFGIHNGTGQDFVMVEADDGTSQLLMHNQPIKILDMKLKKIDPYGEENWEN